MSDKKLQEAYATLKVAMGDNLATIETAYSQHKELFSGPSMACYSLCCETEQQEALQAIKSAHQLILSECFPQPDNQKAENESGLSTEFAMPASGDSPGDFLKKQRQKLDIPLTTIVEQTKVSRTILERIEQENYSLLPATVYLRGFIIEFAKIVRAADPQQIASQYLEQMNFEAS